MNADYIILDLGGGTDYNTLDFFLAADMGIVLTTLDQSAYGEAYGFIKTALQRKLNRLFGADSTFMARKNVALKRLVIENTVMSENGHPQTIQALLEKVAKTDPVSLPLIADEILGFSPHLVINHCFDPAAAFRVASTLRSVACERLSIDINHAGTISKHRAIEQCTSYTHHPVAARQRSSLFVSEMTSIIETLGLSDR
jgi:flagellar biosynthesis protein FlhG